MQICGQEAFCSKAEVGAARGVGGVVFACMPSCIVILINGDRSRSLQAAKLRLTTKDRDRGGTSTVPKDREGGQMGLKRGEGRWGGDEGGGE